MDKFGSSVAHIKAPTWLLTHFHADHYGGLTKGWSQGRLVCTPTTARLVQQKIKVAAARIMEVPLNTPTVIEGELALQGLTGHMLCCVAAGLGTPRHVDTPLLCHSWDARWLGQSTRVLPADDSLPVHVKQPEQ